MLLEMAEGKDGRIYVRRINMDRLTFKGDWKCSTCGCSITELPFEPLPEKKLFCKDCYRKIHPRRY